VDAARAGLGVQLEARAAAAAALGSDRGLTQLAAAAERSAAGYPALRAGAALDTAVEETENELSRALRAPGVASAGQGAPALLHAVDSAAARVALARQLHNDAVRDLRALRGRRLVRVVRLSARRPLPAYFEIDDALPPRAEPGGAPVARSAGAAGGPPAASDQHAAGAGPVDALLSGSAPSSPPDPAA
jgi:hypothetical protein